jgi:glycosyltransferase involved in cell wall biosynthesis
MITIVTPCFNAGSLILELETSLIEERIEELEWIIVDDGSENETLGVLLEIKQKSELKTKIIYSSRQGACHARNIGFQASRRPWVKFVDADDILERGHLYAQLKLATKEPAAIIVSPKHDFFDSLNEKRLERYRGIDVSKLKDPFRKMLIAAPFHHSSALYPRALVEQIGGWDESLCADQDGDFLLRILLNKPKLIWCPGPGFLFRQHSYTKRITNDDSSKKWESRLYVCLKIKGKLEEMNLLDEYRDELALRYDRIAKRALISRSSDQWVKECLKKASDLSHNYLHLEPKYVLWLRSLLGFRCAERLRNRVEKTPLWKRLRYGIRSQ